MANPLLQIELPAETLAQLARLAQHEAKITSSLPGRLRMREAMRVIQAALDTIPCPTCQGTQQIRHRVWDHFYAEIAAEFGEDPAPGREREIDRRRWRFTQEHGPEIEPCPRCQCPAVQQRRAAA